MKTITGSTLVGLAVCAASVGDAHAKVTYNGTSVRILYQGDSDDGKKLQAALAAIPDLDRILAAYDEKGTSDIDHKTIEDLRRHVELDHRFLFEGVIATSSLSAFLAEQDELERHRSASPTLYRERVTTVGFEHEFLKKHTAQTLADARIDTHTCALTLTELDHVEIAKSTQRLRGLPFVIETDSEDQLELVTPPFLMRTEVDGVPLPRYKQLRDYEAMVESYLGIINAEVAAASRKRAPLRFVDLTSSLSGQGISFSIADVGIEASNLTHRTPDVARARKVAADDIKAVCLHSAAKGETLISHQVNFATDALTYTALKYYAFFDSDLDDDARSDLLASGYYEVWFHALAAARSVLASASPSPALKAFVIELAATAANQAAIPSLQTYRSYTTDAFGSPQDTAKVVAKRHGLDEEELEDVESATSHVKDWARVWLKTSLYNFGLGVLTDDGNRSAIVGLLAKGGGLERALALAAPRSQKNPPPPFSTQGAASIRAFSALARARFEQAATSPRPLAPETFAIDGRRIAYTEHDARFLGPRQDTYIDATVDMAEWPERRLFVVEERSEAPHGGLKSLSDALRKAASPSSTVAAHVDWLYEQRGLLEPTPSK